MASRRADCVLHLPKRWLLDPAFSLAQQPIAFCLGTSVPATCRLFGFSFLFRHFSSLPPLSVNSFFAMDCPTRCAACFGDVTIAVAYCKPPCTIHIGCGFVEVWRGPLCPAVLDQCFAWEVVIEPVVELHAASLSCTVQCGVESTEDQSRVSRCCVVSGRGTSTEKSQGRYLAKFDSFQHRVDSSQGLLLVFDSDYSGVCTLAADDHLSGMLPACKQLYSLGHLQNHNWWYCARWTPTVMFSCWLCIDCLLNTWNLVDQFRKLLSNVTWSFSFEISWNRIPERGSPTCCCSRTLNYLKACHLQIAFAWAGLNLPLCVQFLRY